MLLGVLTLAGAAAAGSPASVPLRITLQDALARARANAPALLSATIGAELAHEDRVQARAALLPSLSWLNQFIYTQPNGTPSGVFVSNDGPHVYNNQAVVHADLYAPAKRAELRRTVAAEAVARARAEIAWRGLAATVVAGYYALVSAQRKAGYAQQSVEEAQRFLEITRAQEQGGEAAHVDAIKAEIQSEQRRRERQEADLATEKARINLAVLLFADFQTAFEVADDLAVAAPLPPFAEIESHATGSNPDLAAARAAVSEETYGIQAARAAALPAFSLDYIYGLNANQYAIYNREHLNNLGSVFEAQMTLPVWTWGANRSRIRQAELRLRQAKTELALTQRQTLGNLRAFYLEAQAAESQIASLEHSRALAEDNLRLTLLRYQAGESTALEVVDAQTTLAQSRNAVDDGLARYRVALAGLQTLTGAF